MKGWEGRCGLHSRRAGGFLAEVWEPQADCWILEISRRGQTLARIHAASQAKAKRLFDAIRPSLI